MVAIMLCYIGVPVLTPDGPSIAHAILLSSSFDLPARAICLNMKQWNGAYGCAYCEDAGTTIGGDHLHRYWPYKDSVARTHASLMQNAVNAVTCGNAVSIFVSSTSCSRGIFQHHCNSTHCH